MESCSGKVIKSQVASRSSAPPSLAHTIPSHHQPPQIHPSWPPAEPVRCERGVSGYSRLEGPIWKVPGIHSPEPSPAASHSLDPEAEALDGSAMGLGYFLSPISDRDDGHFEDADEQPGCSFCFPARYKTNQACPSREAACSITSELVGKVLRLRLGMADCDIWRYVLQHKCSVQVLCIVPRWF